MTRRILKWKLPVDDQWHLIPRSFQHCEVDLVDPAVVWLWGLEPSDRLDPASPWEVRAYGTGHDLPDVGSWVGTARHDPTGLVWHVLVRHPNSELGAT